MDYEKEIINGGTEYITNTIRNENRKDEHERRQWLTDYPVAVFRRGHWFPGFINNIHLDGKGEMLSIYYATQNMQKWYCCNLKRHDYQKIKSIKFLKYNNKRENECKSELLKIETINNKENIPPTIKSSKTKPLLNVQKNSNNNNNNNHILQTITLNDQSNNDASIILPPSVKKVQLPPIARKGF